LNYLPLNFIPDTYYGRETEDAVRDFQRRNGLAVTGVADPQTRSLINSTAAVPGPPTSPAISPPEPEDPTDPEVPTEPEDPNPPDLGGFRDATVSTTDGLDALAFSGPGTEYDLLGFIPNDTVVTVTGETQGSWSELDNGSWIYTDFLEF
jgi:peptidoglycan hydrolase-like protein with peptidoglycan-binding domain